MRYQINLADGTIVDRVWGLIDNETNDTMIGLTKAEADIFLADPFMNCIMNLTGALIIPLASDNASSP